MAGSGASVIAGQEATEADPAAGAATLVLHMLWAAIAAAVTWRAGWLRGARPVMWPGGETSDLIRLAIAVIMASPLAAMVGMSMGVRMGAEPTLAQMLAMSVAAGAPAIVAWVVLAPTRPAPGSAVVGVPGAMLAGLAGLAVCWPFLQLAIDGISRLQQVLGGEAAPALGHDTLRALRDNARDPAAWGMAVAAVVVAPLAEEITWRGLVQQALKRARLPVPVAITFAAAAFAMFHWSVLPAAARPGGLAALAMLGATLGWLVERTGRIESAMAAHAAFNLANLLLFSMLPE